MISAGWKLGSPTRGQTLDGSRRCDEGNPARESLQALVGRETQALLDEARVVVLGVLDLSTQSVLDRSLVGAGLLAHGASVLQAHVLRLPVAQAVVDDVAVYDSRRGRNAGTVPGGSQP